MNKGGYKPSNFKKENIELGKRLQKHRKEAGLTQSEMAEFCGLSTNYISATERGVNQCNAKTLMTYAKKTGISAEELYYGEIEKGTILPELSQLLISMSIPQQKKTLNMLKIWIEN